MNALIYDIEILKAVPSPNSYCEKGIKYCSGWSDHERMGISVIGAYDYAEDRYRVFCGDNFTAFMDRARQPGTLLVGFNNIPFDNAVIKQTLRCDLQERSCYDLLREIWSAAGLGPKFDRKTHGGYGLDAVCQANFGTSKSGNGALAPVLWQKGQIGEVIDYCLNDVRLTKQLFDAVIEHGSLTCPKTQKSLTLREPFPVASVASAQ